MGNVIPDLEILTLFSGKFHLAFLLIEEDSVNKMIKVNDKGPI